jgi:hypothetical protein
MISGLIFQPLLGVLLDYSWSGQMLNEVRIYSASDYQHAFAVLPFFILAGSLLVYKLRETLDSKIMVTSLK